MADSRPRANRRPWAMKDDLKSLNFRRRSIFADCRRSPTADHRIADSRTWHMRPLPRELGQCARWYSSCTRDSRPAGWGRVVTGHRGTCRGILEAVRAASARAARRSRTADAEPRGGREPRESRRPPGRRRPRVGSGRRLPLARIPRGRLGVRAAMLGCVRRSLRGGRT